MPTLVSPRSAAVATASSSAFSAVRASPSARAAKNSSVWGSTVTAPSSSPEASARRSTSATSSAESACSAYTRIRESSAPLTSNAGFSVVAPTSVTTPSSTAGSSVSCWALLKRWISSRKNTVPVPLVARRWAARSSTARTSARPACTALSSSNTARERSATIRASVVLPEPGGP